MRNTKRLIVVLITLLVLLSAVHIGLTLWRPPRHVDYVPMLMPLFLAVIFFGTWRRLSLLEAKHGPDYVQPTSPKARGLLIAAAAVAAVLGAVAGFLLVRR